MRHEHLPAIKTWRFAVQGLSCGADHTTVGVNLYYIHYAGGEDC